MRPSSRPADSGDSTLDRLIRILDSFDTRHPSLTVPELAERAGLPTATAYRWTERLVAADLLVREGGRVRPGMRLWELAARSAPAVGLRDAAMPFLHDVHSVLRQHVQLAVLDDEGVLVLERLSGRGAVKNQATVAGRLPTFTTSLGLVLLATGPQTATQAYLDRHEGLLGAPADVGAPGPQAVGVNPTREQLRVRLAQIRREGHAAVDGRLDAETRGIAVPVYGADKVAVAALGVVVPQAAESTPGLPQLLMTAARGISRSLA